MLRKTILNKYRNEMGKRYRRVYEEGLRNDWCNRAHFKSYQVRPDSKCGSLVTFVYDNLAIELYETNDNDERRNSKGCV